MTHKFGMISAEHMQKIDIALQINQETVTHHDLSFSPLDLGFARSGDGSTTWHGKKPLVYDPEQPHSVKNELLSLCVQDYHYRRQGWSKKRLATLIGETYHTDSNEENVAELFWNPDCFPTDSDFARDASILHQKELFASQNVRCRRSHASLCPRKIKLKTTPLSSSVAAL
jgi:hypothetical protein